MSELPVSWVKTTVGELFQTIGGGTPPTGVPKFWNGTIPWISSADISGDHRLSITRFISEEAVKASATNIVPAGSVIVVTRVGLGKVAIADVPLCFSQDHQALLIPDDLLDRRYVLYYMSTAVQTYKHIGRGTTVSGITKKQLLDTDFILPPKPEQSRIVAEIEKQFTRLDAATAALKRVQANLKRYRASVLKAACEGRLVPLGDASQVSSTVPAREILREPLANGRSPQSSDTGARILRLTAIKDGLIDPKEHRKGIVPADYLDKLSIRDEDILISRGNGSVSLVGLAGLVINRSENADPILFPDTMIRVRLDNRLCDPRFFVLVWNSGFVRNQIERTARTTAGIHKISQSDIERFEIPLPSLGDQLAIVSAVERSFASVRRMEVVLRHLDLQIARLRASTLRAAFSGKLTSRNNEDEPAPILLERIRAESASRLRRNLPRRRKESLHV